MTDAEQILLEMSKGFGTLYDRIGDLATQAAKRQLLCHERFSTIEKTVAVKETANCVREVYAKEKRDFWKYIIRGLALAGSLMAAGVLWKMAVLTDGMMKLGIVK